MTVKENIITVIQDKRHIMDCLYSILIPKDLQDKYKSKSNVLLYHAEEIAEKLDICPRCGTERDDFECEDHGYNEMYNVCLECSYEEYSHYNGEDPSDV